MKQLTKPFVLFDRWLDWPTRKLLAQVLFITVLVAGCVMCLESTVSMLAGAPASGEVWVFFMLVGFGGWVRVTALKTLTTDEADDCKKCKTCQARKRERMRGAAYDPEVLRRFPLPLPVNGDLTVENGAVSMSVDTWRAFWEANAAL